MQVIDTSTLLHSLELYTYIFTLSIDIFIYRALIIYQVGFIETLYQPNYETVHRVFQLVFSSDIYILDPVLMLQTVLMTVL